MGMGMNCRRIDGNCSHPSERERERERERCNNVLRNWFILQLISNVELQSCIYRRLALLSLTHMAQDN